MPFQIENLVSYAWLVFNRFYHAQESTNTDTMTSKKWYSNIQM